METGIMEDQQLAENLKKKEEELINPQIEHKDGTQDGHPVIYKGVIKTLLEYKEQNILEEKYTRDQVIVQEIRKIRKPQRLPMKKRVGCFDEPG